MELRKGTLKIPRTMWLAGAVMVAGIPTQDARAADVAAPGAAVESATEWYYFGGLEAGGRYVFDRPPSGFGTTPASAGGNCTVGGGGVITNCFLTASQTQSRAKFEEYGKIPNGPFLDWINLQTGTKDGRFAVEFWGRSVGLNNQSYTLDVSRPGEHYFSFGWEQTPHLMSTSAITVFGGAGSTFLTVNPALPVALTPFLGTAGDVGPGGDAARANIQALINSAAVPLELGTRRDKATGAYRWTPTPDLDFGVEYSHEHRTGVVAASVGQFFDVGTPAATHYPIALPKPIDDTTQNVEANGEYSGISILGARWTSNVAYNGSFYHNSLKELDAQNPFCAPGACDVLGNSQFVAPTMLRLSLDPSNNANGLTWNNAITLPFWKTRYVSTLQFNDMRQNDPFVDTSINGLIGPPVTLNGIAVGSLNGQVDTLLWNNVLTTSPTKDLKFTFRARQYTVDNRTPSYQIADWISIDTQCASGAPNLDGTCSMLARNSLPIAYTKDNVSLDSRWSPERWLAVGGGWYFERWNRTFRDVDVTNENTGKVFVDLTPTQTVHARASYSLGVRRYETYDWATFVLGPSLVADEVALNLRRFDEANRDRQKANAQVDFVVTEILTVSPNFTLRWDDYPDPTMNPLGLQSDHSWNAGVEVGLAVNSQIKVMAAYNYEDERRHMAGGNGAAAGCPDLTVPNSFNDVPCTWFGDIDQRYHTFLAAADVKVIPNKFDLRFEALYTISTEDSQLTPCLAGVGCNGLTGVLDPAAENFGQFPTNRIAYQRYNVIGKYYVDPEIVRQIGWMGDVVVKGRYIFTRNSVANWANDTLTPYVPTPDSILEGGGRALFLAGVNPNYMAHVLAMSVALKW